MRKISKIAAFCLAVACVTSSITLGTVFGSAVDADVNTDGGTEDMVKIVDGKTYQKTADGKIEMVQDQNFHTGINLLGVHPSYDGREVKARLDYSGEALSATDIDPWEMTQWYSSPSLAEGLTHTTQGDYEYFKGSAGEKLVRVNRYKKELYMQLDTRYTLEEKNGSQWPHILIEKSPTYKPTFGSLNSINASLKFSIEDFQNFNDANGGQAAQVSWWFFVTDGTNDCWFGLPLFDNRQDIDGLGTYVGDELGWEANTLDATVKVARSRFAPHITQVKVGTMYEVNVDIKEYFQVALDQLKTKYTNFNANIDNFYITGWNFGWEMPYGTYKAGVCVSDISILVEEK
ncbi:MAG: hypothetical protein IJ329_02380 [Clostridia bacterium]|nr:hypothetical protein [Clostridia bacterium]